MALWRGLRVGQDFCPSPEAPKTSCRTSGGRSKRPKTKRLSNSKRETLKERTNTLTASYEANTSEGYVPPYGWFCPEQPLLERRCRTDQRREELLQLLYREKESQSDQIDELVSEWVSLLVERDKLFHEQVNKELCTEYFRELHRMLRAQPALGNAAQEMDIREVLMDFERCVTKYCRERNILTASQRPLSRSNTFSRPMFFHPPPSLSEESDHLFPSIKLETDHTHHPKPHLLDQETGQASIQIEGPAQEGHLPPLEDNSSGSLFKEAAAAEIPVSECLHASRVPMATQSGIHNRNASSNVFTESAYSGQGLFDSLRKPISAVILSSLEEAHSTQGGAPGAVSSHTTTSTILPPPRPSLPPATSTSPPPLPPSPLLPLGSTISPTHRVIPMKGGVTGTVQFAGMAPAAISTPSQSTVSSWKKRLFGFGRDEPDTGVPVRTEDRKNLLDEISTMGHAVLKTTNQPRSPGGTPVKVTCGVNQVSSTGTTGNNSDVIQRALMTKFRSLHSTPLHQSRLFHSGSMDVSSAWSDLNASLVFDDPDISASSFASNNQLPRNSKSLHNGSSAV